MLRSPAVANQFYPGNAGELSRMLRELIPPVALDQKKKAKAVISPHAGYIYSGGVAGETFAQVDIPQDIVILGPNHHGQGARIALMGQGEWVMPMGNVPINEELASKLSSHSPEIRFDVHAHTFEHSLEVQVSFLQYLRSDVRIAPIVVGHIPYALCEEVGRAIALAIKEYEKPVLIVASTDMTHYESRSAATKKDSMAMAHILHLDPSGLYHTVLGESISMCGIMPTTVALIAAKELGAQAATLVRYTDSGERSGDTQHVVGYAGFILT